MAFPNDGSLPVGFTHYMNLETISDMATWAEVNMLYVHWMVVCHELGHKIISQLGPPYDDPSNLVHTYGFRPFTIQAEAGAVMSINEAMRYMANVYYDEEVFSAPTWAIEILAPFRGTAVWGYVLEDLVLPPSWVNANAGVIRYTDIEIEGRKIARCTWPITKGTTLEDPPTHEEIGSQIGVFLSDGEIMNALPDPGEHGVFRLPVFDEGNVDRMDVTRWGHW